MILRICVDDFPGGHELRKLQKEAPIHFRSILSPKYTIPNGSFRDFDPMHSIRDVTVSNGAGSKRALAKMSNWAVEADVGEMDEGGMDVEDDVGFMMVGVAEEEARKEEERAIMMEEENRRKRARIGTSLDATENLTGVVHSSPRSALGSRRRSRVGRQEEGSARGMVDDVLMRVGDDVREFGVMRAMLAARNKARGACDLEGFAATEWTQGLMTWVDMPVPSGFQWVDPFLPGARLASQRAEAAGSLDGRSVSLWDMIDAVKSSRIVAIRLLGRPHSPASVWAATIVSEDGAGFLWPLGAPETPSVERSIVDAVDRWVALMWVNGSAVYDKLPPRLRSLDDELSKELSGLNRWLVLSRLLSLRQGPLLVAEEWKPQLHAAIQMCPALATAARSLLDLSVAAWMINSDALTLRGRKAKQAPPFADLCRILGASVPSDDQSLLQRMQATISAGTCAVEQLRSRGLELVAHTLEMPLIPLLARLEVVGLAIDTSLLESAKTTLEERLKSIEQEAHTVAGETFLLTSPKAVAHVLYDKLGLPAPPIEGKQTHASTSSGTLEGLVHLHPLPSLLLSFRSLHKLLTGFISPLQSAAVPPSSDSLTTSQLRSTQTADHLSLSSPSQSSSSSPLRRVHAQLWAINTATGRLAATAPNLMTLPKHSVSRVQAVLSEDTPSASSSSSSTTDVASIRRCVQARNPDQWILSVDFSQIEMRLLAHCSSDRRLQHVMADAAADVYRAAAANAFLTSVDQVSDDQRQLAKALCLGAVYGQGVKEAALKLKVPESDVTVARRKLFDAFRGIPHFIQTARRDAKAKGVARTICWRMRSLPGIRSPIPGVRAEAERRAVNTVIQGSAADLMNAAMLLVARLLAGARKQIHGPALGVFDEAPGATELLAFNPEATQALSQCELVLQIHDELLLECPRDPALYPLVAQHIKHCMEKAAPDFIAEIARPQFQNPASPPPTLGPTPNLAVPILAKAEIGPSYGDLHSLSLE